MPKYPLEPEERGFFLVFTNLDLLRLITSYHAKTPKYFFIRGRKHLLPLYEPGLMPDFNKEAKYAIKRGNLEYLEYIKTRATQAFNFSLFRLAVKKGKLEIIKKYEIKHLISVKEYIITRSAKGGYFHVVKWVIGNLGKIDPFYIDHIINDKNLEIMQYLYENKLCKYTSDALRNAAEHGYMDAIKWLHKINCNIDYETITRAATYGKLKAIKFIYKNWDYPLLLRQVSLHDAVERGHLHVLKWFYKKGHLPDNLLGAACRGGQMKIIEWLHSIGKTNIDKDPILIAAKYGHFNIVKWLLTNNYGKLSPEVMEHAAKYNLETLKWVAEQGYEFSPKITSSAAGFGKLDILMWLYEKNEIKDVRQAIRFAITSNQLEVVKWLYQKYNLIYQLDDYLPTFLGNQRSLEIVKWIVGLYPPKSLKLSLHLGPYPKSIKWLMENAIVNIIPPTLFIPSNIEHVKLYISMGYEYNVEETLRSVIFVGEYEVITYLFDLHADKINGTVLLMAEERGYIELLARN